MKYYPLVKLCLPLVRFICAKSIGMLTMELQAKKHSLRNVSFKLNFIWRHMSNRLDGWFMHFHYYSLFFKWLLFLDWDSSFYKCAILTCRRSVKRISWNKIGLPTSGTFVTKLCPSLKLMYVVLLVWWESQFMVESRSYDFKMMLSLDRRVKAALQFMLQRCIVWTLIQMMLNAAAKAKCYV